MSSLTLQEWQCIFSNKTAQHSFQAGNFICFRSWYHMFFSSWNSLSLCLSFLISTMTDGFDTLNFRYSKYYRTQLQTIHKAAPLCDRSINFPYPQQKCAPSSSLSCFHSLLHLFFFTRQLLSTSLTSEQSSISRVFMIKLDAAGS